jgi:hypothetical protein
MSRQLIVNNENGQYTKPSPALLTALLQLANETNEYELISEYKDWQREIRRLNFGVLVHPFPSNWDPTTHPVVHWAAVSNVPYTRISRLYCVHQALMDRLKNKPFLMTSLPTTFTGALIDSGYPHPLVLDLESKFQVFKHNERCKLDSKGYSKVLVD